MTVRRSDASQASSRPQPSGSKPSTPNAAVNSAASKASSKAAAPIFSNPRFDGVSGQLDKVADGTVTLGQGAKGEGVKAVQDALLSMGFYLNGGADGSFGPQSAKAVKNFQIHASAQFPDVKPTGVVDAATLRALDKTAPLPGQRGDRGNLPSPFYDGKPVRVVVVENEHRTYLFDKNGKLQDIFANAVGKASTQTDTGLKKVTGKLDQAAVQRLGKQLWGNPNVFGPCLVDLSWADGRGSGEELHGTDDPTHIGEDVSHGCMRHTNEDILKLYGALNIGDGVAVVKSVDDSHLRKSRFNVA